jgi:prepilin-type N-terminal cleavage/methylation domain-containing protein
MTDPLLASSGPASLPGRAGRSGREGGFTLLEIMVALAIFAVGAVCVLSTFAAALALHLRRESSVQGARVLEEARHEAQSAWDAWDGGKAAPLPPPLKALPFSRDPTLTYSVTFEAVPGQPQGPEGTSSGAMAVVRVERGTDEKVKALEQRLFLVRGRPTAREMKESVTFEREQKEEKERRSDPAEKKPK